MKLKETLSELRERKWREILRKQGKLESYMDKQKPRRAPVSINKPEGRHENS